MAKIDRTDKKDNVYFLRDALDDLSNLFTRQFNEIPWFILSSKCDDSRKAIVMFTVGRERRKKDWGEVDNNMDQMPQLMSKISELLPNVKNYRLRSVYEPVFDVLEKLFPKKTKDLLFSILQPLHYPEVFYSFVPTDYYNNLRRIVESYFAVCCKYGLIPNDICYSHDNNGSVNLKYSSDYLKNGDGRLFCPISISCILDNIRDITNEGSHMGDEYKTRGQYYTIMAFSLQICDALIWLGKYIKENGCHSIEELIPQYKGQEILIEFDERENGIYCYGQCSLPRNSFVESAYKNQRKVRITDVFENKSFTRKYFPLTAHVKPIS